MKFVISYSGGKDSMLALHKMIALGHQPQALLVMYNSQAKRSWFHGIDLELLNKIAQSLEIPLLCCNSSSDNYASAFENGLLQAKKMGAELCVFGDIDLEEHRQWCVDRCNNTNMLAEFPLWQLSREELVIEFIKLNYTAILKCIDHTKLPQHLLGEKLSLELIDIFKQYKIDVCGENGEYHTIVTNGPLFKQKIQLEKREIVSCGNYSAINLITC